MFRSTQSASFSFEELKGCMAAASRMNLVAVGDVVAELSGIPIGGFLSKCATSVVLNAAEAKFETRFQKLRDLVAMLRYVDDVIMVSHKLCRKCLCELLPQVYPVTFDISAESRTLLWLDVALDLDHMRYSFAPKGYSTVPAWASCSKDLRAYVIGRVHRWEELELPNADLVQHALSLASQLLQCQWQPKALRSFLYATRGREQTPALRAMTLAIELSILIHPTSLIPYNDATCM